MEIKKIAEGFTNVAKEKLNMLAEEELELINKRREICAGCPFNSVNAKKEGFYNSFLPYDHCIYCDCAIVAKTACIDCVCGIDVYNKKNKKNLELKW